MVAQHHVSPSRPSRPSNSPRLALAAFLEGELEGGEPMEVSETVHHNGFCILCRDGSASFQENPLFMCNHCPRVMCRLCMELPLDTEDVILGEDVSFMCICCHMKVAEEGAPYFGFYYPDGTTVLKSFLRIQASLEVSVLAEISAAPILFIHLVLIDFKTTGSPFPFAHSFLQPYFTSGGIEYCEIAYDIISAPDAYLKTVAQIIKTLNKAFVWECIVIGISTHTDNDQGDIFAGYSDDGGDKHYVSAGSDQFLEFVLRPWQSVLDCAKETYLWLLCCGSLVNNTDAFAGLQSAVVRHKLSATIAFNARCFQPSFTSHLLLAFTEHVLVEHCPICSAFGEMLGQSSKLGHHTDVLLLTPLEATLQITKFTWGDTKFRPWGCFLPIQCQTCGHTNSWHSAYARDSGNKTYLFECKNTSCDQSFTFIQPKGATMLSSGVSSSPGIPKHKPMPVPPPSKHKMFVMVYTLQHHYLAQFFKHNEVLLILRSANSYRPAPVSFCDIMASWTLIFSDVLNQHKDSFVAAKGNSVIRARILKTIKDAIGSSDAAQDPCVMLPEKNLRKAIHTYYLDFLEDHKDHKAEEEIIEGGHKDRSAADAVTVEMVRERENEKPEEAGKYKTEFSGFDVAQKLFKDEFGEYDKMHRDTTDQKSMGQRTKLARAWHQAMSSEVKQELVWVAGKWNREGPPADTKDSHGGLYGHGLQNYGVASLILTAHDQGEGKAPGTTLWETSPLKAKKTFTQTSNDNKKWAGDAQDCLTDWLLEAEYADEEDSDGEDSDDDDLPDLTVEVDNDGHPCLPKGFGSLKLKHRQKVVRTVFQKAYCSSALG
ncbi:hypothetical protein EDB19DRAFT_1827760 [Suillus lakei]|nr:hypothetical protein EDB19DRAFT_1827760 [Suillus lakei]